MERVILVFLTIFIRDTMLYNERKINFGSKNGQTFIDHKNHDIRRAWIARHSKIKNSNNQYVINLKTSPAYWSRHILW
jgi:hypothetical protein